MAEEKKKKAKKKKATKKASGEYTLYGGRILKDGVTVYSGNRDEVAKLFKGGAAKIEAAIAED